MRLFDNSVKHGNSNHYCCIHCFPSLYFLLRTALQVVVILQLQWPTTATQSHSNCCVTAGYKIDCNIIAMWLHHSCNKLLFILLIQKFHIVTTTMQTMISAILATATTTIGRICDHDCKLKPCFLFQRALPPCLPG